MQQPSVEKEAIGPHIMIIASDIQIIKLFRLGLQTVGYKVAGYQYRPDILEIVKSEKPHLIILELSISNGVSNESFTLFRKLREDKVIQECPIIILREKSSNLLFQNIEADGFITRPFDFDDVVEQVNSFIAHLNPQFSRPVKGFLFRADNPPPHLRGKFHT